MGSWSKKNNKSDFSYLICVAFMQLIMVQFSITDIEPEMLIVTKNLTQKVRN